MVDLVLTLNGERITSLSRVKWACNFVYVLVQFRETIESIKYFCRIHDDVAYVFYVSQSVSVEVNLSPSRSPNRTIRIDEVAVFLV